MIVITGGLGFIGSALIYKLNKIGITDIIIVDLLEDNHLKYKNVERLKYREILDPFNFLEEFKRFKDIDVIFHFGAITDTLSNDEEKFMKYNLNYSVSLGNLCKEYGKRLIYASSAATYGNGDNFNDDEGQIYSLKPLNIYGRSKHLFDIWIKENNLFNEWASLKFFNVYGPNEYHKGRMASFIYQSIKQAEKGKIRLFKSYKKDIKDGEQKRDFIYIKDVVDMIIFVYEKRLKGIFNIGTGIARSFIDIVQSVSYALKRKIDIEFIDMPEEIRDSYQYYTCADIRKIKDAGYNKKFWTLEEGVEDYLNYIKNSDYLWKEDL
uniref:ADP-glyceromanno-heptose 6-epimerase n=1 Tax=candidate division WOR-3 bacterium TaxID=2052148 RepID=A0A7C4YA20_UNCW3